MKAQCIWPTRTASNWPIPVYMPCSSGSDRAKLVSGHKQYAVLPSLNILPTKRKISLCLESTRTKVVQLYYIQSSKVLIQVVVLLILNKY